MAVFIRKDLAEFAAAPLKKAAFLVLVSTLRPPLGPRLLQLGHGGVVVGRARAEETCRGHRIHLKYGSSSLKLIGSPVRVPVYKGLLFFGGSKKGDPNLQAAVTKGFQCCISAA